MRRFLKRYSAPMVAVIVVGTVLFVMFGGPNSTPKASSPVFVPAPTASAAPDRSPQLHVQPAPSASPVVSAAQPTSAAPSSAADTKAQDALNTHWATFADAVRLLPHKMLLESQLNRPPVVFVKKLSGCTPSSGNDPRVYNITAGVIKAAAQFCEGKIELNSAAFTKLSTGQQRIATANVWLYSVLAVITPSQRSLNYTGPLGPRGDPEILGCLQATLSLALEFEGGSAEDVWVVMGDKPYDAVRSAYYAAVDFDGEWH